MNYNVVEKYQEEFKEKPGYIEDKDIIAAKGEDHVRLRRYRATHWTILRIKYEKMIFHENKVLAIYPTNATGDTNFTEPLYIRHVPYYEAVRMANEGNLSGIVDFSRSNM